jgi:hypothetical protein
MSESKSSSKTDLNESNMPLLEAEEKTAEKADIPEKTLEVREMGLTEDRHGQGRLELCIEN